MRPSSQTETHPKDSGKGSEFIVGHRSDKWYLRLLRVWPAVAVYVLATAGTVWAAAWSVGTDPDWFAATLVGAAAGNTVCAVLGILRLVRS
ncbi:hypothetical protein [Micromonospora globispora]|uniref:hypothetical protein n=1 Tax=Micromonospora globispora TaxID=1450148 RepID=UPI000FB6402D|nr:hypothetical protein [Micromonospora globispora]RQW83562.1 hypothetical protein DKL51_31555 [Micromonospora globispora]